VRLLCEVLKVSKSGYYAWLDREISERTYRHKILLEAIKKIFEGSRRTYGYRRVYICLRRLGYHVGINQIYRLMQKSGLVPHYQKQFITTTVSKNDQVYFKNILNRRFSINKPNKYWVADITYIPTYNGWLYLSVIMDIFSRKVVGWSMKDTTHDDLVIDALRMAINRRCYSAQVDTEMILHSDRGCQYASNKYVRMLIHNNITPSMSRKGNCWDNAVIESFFKTLKTELLGKKRKFIDKSEARTKIFEYIEVFYNKLRIHSSLGYYSPDSYEKMALAG
jgi:putative transposase